MIDKAIIFERKQQYGNNFPLIAELWNNYLKNIKTENNEITPEDVAIMMGLMKISRLANSPEHADSLIDLLNYLWIGNNYDEYCEIGLDKNDDVDYDVTIPNKNIDVQDNKDILKLYENKDIIEQAFGSHCVPINPQYIVGC